MTNDARPGGRGAYDRAVLIMAILLAGAVALVAVVARGPRLRDYLVLGGFLVAFCAGALAFVAWSMREDGHAEAPMVISLLGLAAGGLLLLGLGPFVPWALGRSARPLRLPDRLPGGVAAGVAVALTATAVAVTALILDSARESQQRAAYRPEARPGALVVQVTAGADAVLRRELPGVPVVRDHDVPGLRVGEPDSELPRSYIGDRALLGYLTGDPAVPYDESAAVLVTDAATAATVEIRHGDAAVRTVPATTVRPAHPGMYEIFIPAKLLRDLGLRPEPEALVVDPSAHRVTAAEQERLVRALGAGAVHVERGYQERGSRWAVAEAPALVALAGALAAAALTAGAGRPRPASAGRAGALAALATVAGGAAGCVIGLAVAWPWTASNSWDPLPRAPFDTPWALIAALVAGLPVLTATLTALLPSARRAPADDAGARL
ncbi:hypothetical protein [Nonomuraea sp. NPDC003214]